MPTCNLPMLTYTCYARVPLSRHWPRLSPTMCLSKYVCITTIKYKHHPLRTTDHDDWPRYDSTILTYGDASVCNFWHTWTCLGGKFPLFFSLRTHYETCSLLKKMCLYASFDTRVHDFEHNFPLVHPMWCVYKIVSTAGRDNVQVFTKIRISALVWLTWTPPCATFDICGHWRRNEGFQPPNPPG